MTIPKKIPKISQGTHNLIRLAKSYGVPADSLKRFLAAGYIPQPKQLQFHAEMRAADTNDVEELMYGGARGGAKTHCVFAGTAIDDCQKFNDLNVLFLRKKAGSAEESLEKLVRKILLKVPHKSKQTSVIFPNGSNIKLGHFQYEKDIDNYLSLEYDCIIIEQAEQLTPGKLIDIGTCNRNSRSDYKPRIYLTVNPGNVGHTYLKNKFVIPWRNGKQINTRFIQATIDDNKFVNKTYRNKLEALTGWKREAWLKGSWDVFAGQFFSNFSYERHVLHPVQMPQPKAQQLTVWCNLDYGYKHWMMCYLFCEFDGVIYVLDELARRKTLIGPYCDDIKQMLGKYGLHLADLANFYAGADVFGKKGDTGESYADEFAKHGVFLRVANTNREQGAGRILQILGDVEQLIEPTVKISSNCEKLIETLPILEHNPDRPNDVLKIDTDDEGNGGDDAYDAFRYGVNVNNSIGITI